MADDRLRKSDLDRLTTAMLHAGIRDPQFTRIMAPLHAALLGADQHGFLVKQAPAVSQKSSAEQED